VIRRRSSRIDLDLKMPRRPVKIDWEALERTLFRLTRSELRDFAKKHAQEVFYGFAFDCNSAYGEVGLCANTKQLLKAQRRAVDPNAAFFASLDKKLRLANTASPSLRRESRWHLGDWDYQAFSRKRFDRSWRRFEAVLAKTCETEEEDRRSAMKPTQKRFMESVCRVLVRLERVGAFDLLRRTGDFSTLAMDHDESESTARARLRRIRRQAMVR